MSKLSKIIWITLLQILMLWQGNLFSASFDTLFIDHETKEVQLGKYIRYLSDTSNQMTLDGFLEATAPTVATLQINKMDEVFLGYGQHQYWFQFNLKNTIDEHKIFYLNIAYPNLDHFIVYQNAKVRGRDSVVQIAEMGDDFVRGNKEISNRNYIIPIHLQPNESVGYLFQVKKQWEPVNFPLILTDEYSLVRRTNNDNLFLGVFYGVYLLFSLTLFSLYLFTRNTFFFFYLLLNILGIINFLSDTGTGFQYIWYMFPLVQKLLPYIVIIGTILIHITFIRIFFRTSLHLVKFNRFLLGLVWTLIITVLALIVFALCYPSSNLPFQIGYNIVNSLYLGYGILIIALSVSTWLKTSRKEVLWVVIVVCIQFSNWVIQILMRGNAFTVFLQKLSVYDWNLFPSLISTPHINIVLTLVEIFVVTIILALNFYGYIKDNSSGQYKLMMLNRNTINAYIEGQENERVKLTERIKESIGLDISMLRLQMLDAIKNINHPIVKSVLLSLSNDVQSIENEVDKISTDFVPSNYSNKSFYDAIKSIFSTLNASNIQVKYQLAVPSPRVNDFSKLNVCRILQEITGNIIKHSQAKHVQLKIFYNKDLSIEVHDDGIGFNNSDNQGGIGLLNIESRVKGMNGSVSIQSAENKGTVIIIKIPMKEMI
ncbi:MAG: ATP-binding protein [Chitinophagales bacterium]|nr:ATP-binding protein [Chitinophagales bacterium]